MTAHLSAVSLENHMRYHPTEELANHYWIHSMHTGIPELKLLQSTTTTVYLVVFFWRQHIPAVSKQAIVAATGRRRRLQLLCAQAASGAQECSKAGQQSGIFISRCSSKLLTQWVSVVAPEPEGRVRRTRIPSRGTKFALRGGFTCTTCIISHSLLLIYSTALNT